MAQPEIPSVPIISRNRNNGTSNDAGLSQMKILSKIGAPMNREDIPKYRIGVCTMSGCFYPTIQIAPDMGAKCKLHGGPHLQDVLREAWDSGRDFTLTPKP